MNGAHTDLFIENNHCLIPSGASRTVTIQAAKKPGGGLTLAQTGLEVRVQGDAWFSWDTMDLISSKEGESADDR